MENCPRELGDNRSQQGSGRGDLLHHLRLVIEVGVVVAHLSKDDAEA